jgi:exopolysaccharide/PEP-CTERM locus tyrosine autokinase
MSMVEKALAKVRPSTDGGVRIDRTDELPIIDPSAAVLDPSRMVAINRASLQALGLLPDASQTRRLADQYRQIKRSLIAKVRALSAERKAAAQLVMLASALPGDGKTFTSINLALSIARERDVTILLVDADVLKPRLSGILGVDREPGLMDALIDESANVESFILPTDVPGLSILPAGRKDEAATELLGSTRMAKVVARLTARDPRRIVLFDSPPLLPTSESRALAQSVGLVLLVVRAGATPRSAVLDAIGLIDADKPVALVLNQSLMATSDSYYGYGDYGNYGDTPPLAAAEGRG